MEFLQVCGLRRSIRWFKPWERVPREKIQRVLEVVRVAVPSPGNIQPWRAVVVERDEVDAEVRQALLRANNFQASQAQAPVWIYWFADIEAGMSETFRQRTHELFDVGALPSAYGWSHEQIDASFLRGELFPEGGPPLGGTPTLPPEAAREQAAGVARAEVVGATAVAVLAAVNEGLGTCLHSVCRPQDIPLVRQLLQVPETWLPVWIQLLGYPAEDWEAGGQRPRLPFESLFFLGRGDRPFPRDPEVVVQLEREGLLRAPAPKPGRFEELKYLARMFGYPI